jgi:hypothetical protein
MATQQLRWYQDDTWWRHNNLDNSVMGTGRACSFTRHTHRGHVLLHHSPNELLSAAYAIQQARQPSSWQRIKPGISEYEAKVIFGVSSYAPILSAVQDSISWQVCCPEKNCVCVCGRRCTTATEIRVRGRVHWTKPNYPARCFYIILYYIIFFTGSTAPLGPGLWFSVSWSFYRRQDSLHEGSALPKHRTTQTQNKHIDILNIHALCGIRTHDPGFRASENSTS